MTKYEKETPVTHGLVSAVSYYLEKDTYLPGMIEPHTYKGWHAFWKIELPNGETTGGQVVGPFQARDQALTALYWSTDALQHYRQIVKDKHDDQRHTRNE